MAWLREIVIDCDHPAALARFWAAAIDGYAVRAYDEAEIAMLQDRPESEVKADIEAARQTVKERLVAAGQVDEAGRPTAAAGPKGSRQSSEGDNIEDDSSDPSECRPMLKD